MSEVKVNKISPRTACGTVTLGDSGDTIALGSGASQTGFGRTGTVDWQTGSIKTSTFTAANGEGYFANTSGGAFTMNLPAGSAGNIVSVVDYTNTFSTYNLTISPNGSEKIGGTAGDSVLNTTGQSVTLVYVDGTEGWKNVQDSTSNAIGNPFLTATGGNTVTTCGNFKIHTFTSPGTFTVSAAASTAAENTVGYMVVAGGGGGGPGSRSGGGGAGGFREGRNVPIDNFTASPLVANAPTNAVTVTATAYPITVGAGGTAGVCGNGSNSIFSSITSTGGGRGLASPTPNCKANGGSGGGACGRDPQSGGTGNTPPVTPSQGNNGGTASGAESSPDTFAGAGGGGAGAVGSNNPSATQAGAGGAGVSTSITAAAVTRAGGGGGGSGSSALNAGSGGAGGSGGGGAGGGGSGGAPTRDGTNATANTGSGGGGNAYTNSPPGNGTSGNGGSGIVVIRYKFQ